MICDKCEGRGRVDNKTYWRLKYSTHDHHLFHNPSIRCRKCGGHGYVIIDLKGLMILMDSLKIELEKRGILKEYTRQIEQALENIKS